MCLVSSLELNVIHELEPTNHLDISVSKTMILSWEVPIAAGVFIEIAH